MNTSDFRRVEISEEVKTDWTDKETLHLLEVLMHYGDDWKKVAEHVGGRSAKECVARFVKLPFGEQFMGPPVSAEVDNEPGSETILLPSKRMRLTPLADASNPIMAQVLRHISYYRKVFRTLDQHVLFSTHDHEYQTESGHH